MPFASWSKTPALNVLDSGVSGSGGTITLDGTVMTPSQVDDADRSFMAQLAAGVAPITKAVTKTTGTYTAAAVDNNQFWRTSGGAVTINLTAAATLGDGWCLWLRAGQSSPITIDPNGAETIDTVATKIIPEFHVALLICTGTTFFFEIYSPLLTAFNVWTGFITGLALTNNAGDASNDIDIAVGAARDGSDVFTMVTVALTKQLDVAWAVGNAAGGLDTGAVGNNAYYVWLIRRSDTGVVDVLFSLSATAPTMPANYDQKRVIGSLSRVGAVNTVARSYSVIGPVLEASQATTSGTAKTFTVPPDTKRVTMTLSGVSTNGTNNIVLGIGDSGGIETTLYNQATGLVAAAGNAMNNGAGAFLLATGVTAASAYTGTVTLHLQDAATFRWVASWVVSMNGGTTQMLSGAGYRALDSVLTSLELSAGGNTFDAGMVNVMYE